jgi:hypothetical protein
MPRPGTGPFADPDRVAGDNTVTELLIRPADPRELSVLAVIVMER